MTAPLCYQILWALHEPEELRSIFRRADPFLLHFLSKSWIHTYYFQLIRKSGPLESYQILLDTGLTPSHPVLLDRLLTLPLRIPQPEKKLSVAAHP